MNATLGVKECEYRIMKFGYPDARRSCEGKQSVSFKSAKWNLSTDTNWASAGEAPPRLEISGRVASALRLALALGHVHRCVTTAAN